MKTETRKIEGDYCVEGELALNGMVTGTTTVAPGGSLHLHGICCGDLVVTQGATAVILGTVVGNLVNQGVVELRGTINSNVSTKSGRFQKSPSAMVRGSVEG